MPAWQSVIETACASFKSVSSVKSHLSCAFSSSNVSFFTWDWPIGAQNNALAKLPLLKQGDYDTWRLIIESYIQLQDYALWVIIEDGNSFKPVARTTINADGTSTSTIPGAVTAEEKIQKKNDLKVQSILMMTLPSEHLLTFNQHKEANTLFEAIEARFGGNEATKKTQKTLLKQMYENFNASNSESLDSIFTRLQKIVSQLAILGENISQEDLNFKFLRSIPSIWRNKPDLGSISFDDLYNNFKIVEQEVKRSIISSSNSSSQNVAFVLTLGSTNDVNTSNVHVSTTSSSLSIASTTDNTARLSDATIYAFLANQPNGSQVVHEDLEQIHEDDLEEMDLKWQLALLSMNARKFYQITGKKIIINESDTVGYDKTKVECFNCHKMGHFVRECRNPRSQDYKSRNQDSSRKIMNVEESSSKSMLAIDGVGFDWSFMTEEKTPTNFALMAFSDSKIERLKKEKESNQIKIDNFENASKSLDKLIGCQISDNNRKGVGYNDVPPPPTGLFAPPTIDLSNSGLEEFKQPEFEGYRVKVNKSVSENSSNEIKKTSSAPIIEDWISDCDEDETLEKVSESANVQKPKQADQPRKISQNPRNNSLEFKGYLISKGYADLMKMLELRGGY
ncbi:putative ribonuclease H-like domain-containing protein [Tanacetum coccineum]